MKRAAFTLIELLMVVLIVALLLTLLVPGITAAVRAANRARCNGNLKAVGVALHNYFSDHQRWPERVNPPTPYAWDDAWYDQLFTKYIPNPKILYCPDNNHDMAPPGDVWQKSWTGERRELSYVILDGMPAPTAGPEDHYNQKLGMLNAVGSWNMVDFESRTQGFRCVQNERNFVNNAWTTTVTYPITRPLWSAGVADSKNVPIMGDLLLENVNGGWVVNHGTVDNENPLGMNILYADGHAAFVSPEKPADDPAVRQTQRLWRRIWRGPGNTYVRWLVHPTEIRLPDKTNPRP